MLPGSLGTQRLPRLVRIERALEMMLGGQPITAEAALAEGLIDAIETGDPSTLGAAYARQLLAQGSGPRPTRERSIVSASVAPDFFADALVDVQRKRGPYPAPQAIVRALQAAVAGDFDAGAALEAKLFDECRLSPVSRAMRHTFFAERAAGKIPGLVRAQQQRRIAKVGVIGAGTMGGGIAMNFANAGIATVIVESESATLERGLATVRRNYAQSAAKGKLTLEGVEQRMALLTGSLDMNDLADYDLVIEAVYENMEIKQQVLSKLGGICKAGAILATNTSTLDVKLIAQASGRPQSVVGMHFFSPANVMRLLEVVRGDQTSPEVLATVMYVARRIGKTAVVSGVCYGFIGNRMAESYMRENEFLLIEGATPAQIDAAIEDPARVGLAMGPCRMLDMAGIDVGAKTLIELRKIGGVPPDPSYRAVAMRLFEQGRLGQKTGSGYYRYDGRTPLAEPDTALVCKALAAEYGVAQREHVAPQEIVERLLYPMINEAARILEEGVAFRPGDIDIVWTAGYGFPDHRGGPLFMADEIGLATIVERLNHYARVRSNTFGYWTPCKLLTDLAASGQRISDWRPH